MNNPDDKTEVPGKRHSDKRGHFLVDINTVLPIFGKQFFLIFYFGSHLHPRQTQLVNQRRAANWVVVALLLASLVGLVYGTIELINWRLERGETQHKGQSTHLMEPLVAPQKTLSTPS